MNDNNKKQAVSEEFPLSVEGKQAGGFSWRRMLAKKWAFPAMYMVAAGIILTLMWMYQGSGKHTASDKPANLESVPSGSVTESVSHPDALPVAAAVEQMQWPVKDRNDVEVSLPYFDSTASGEAKQAAMVEYGDTFAPHVGVDLARQDNQPFDVLAALSGKVTRVEQNPLVGNLVEITHPNGMITVYQSLSDIKIAKGADVKKGDVLATAGRNEMEKDEGVHMHFEVRQGQDGPPVNPEQLITNK